MFGCVNLTTGLLTQIVPTTKQNLFAQCALPLRLPAIQLEGGRAQERAAGRGDAAERPGDGTAGNFALIKF